MLEENNLVFWTQHIIRCYSTLMQLTSQEINCIKSNFPPLMEIAFLKLYNISSILLYTSFATNELQKRHLENIKKWPKRCPPWFVSLKSIRFSKFFRFKLTSTHWLLRPVGSAMFSAISNLLLRVIHPRFLE